MFAPESQCHPVLKLSQASAQRHLLAMANFQSRSQISLLSDARFNLIWDTPWDAGLSEPPNTDSQSLLQCMSRIQRSNSFSIPDTAIFGVASSSSAVPPRSEAHSSCA